MFQPAYRPIRNGKPSHPPSPPRRTAPDNFPLDPLKRFPLPDSRRQIPERSGRCRQAFGIVDRNFCPQPFPARSSHGVSVRTVNDVVPLRPFAGLTELQSPLPCPPPVSDSPNCRPPCPPASGESKTPAPPAPSACCPASAAASPPKGCAAFSGAAGAFRSSPPVFTLSAIRRAPACGTMPSSAMPYISGAASLNSSVAACAIFPASTPSPRAPCLAPSTTAPCGQKPPPIEPPACMGANWPSGIDIGSEYLARKSRWTIFVMSPLFMTSAR